MIRAAASTTLPVWDSPGRDIGLPHRDYCWRCVHAGQCQDTKPLGRRCRPLEIVTRARPALAPAGQFTCRAALLPVVGRAISRVLIRLQALERRAGGAQLTSDWPTAERHLLATTSRSQLLVLHGDHTALFSSTAPAHRPRSCQADAPLAGLVTGTLQVPEEVGHRGAHGSVGERKCSKPGGQSSTEFGINDAFMVDSAKIQPVSTAGEVVENRLQRQTTLRWIAAAVFTASVTRSTQRADPGRLASALATVKHQGAEPTRYGAVIVQDAGQEVTRLFAAHSVVLDLLRCRGRRPISVPSGMAISIVAARGGEVAAAINPGTSRTAATAAKGSSG